MEVSLILLLFLTHFSCREGDKAEIRWYVRAARLHLYRYSLLLKNRQSMRQKRVQCQYPCGLRTVLLLFIRFPELPEKNTRGFSFFRNRQAVYDVFAVMRGYTVPSVPYAAACFSLHFLTE